MSAGDAAFELIGGSLGNQLPLIENCDPVGELVRFLQVLRGEQDRHTAGHEVADDLPHRVAAARVQAGGWLIEENDAGVADQGHREVESPPHTARVGDRQRFGRVDQVKAFEQCGCPLPAFTPTQVVQVCHQEQVLLAGEQVVHR